MNWRAPGARVIFAMFALCLSLDVFAYFGMLSAPDAVGRAICAMRPATFIAQFVFPGELSQYTADICGSFPAEPAISIMVFMLKFSLVSLSIVVIAATVPLREKSADPQESAHPSSKERAYTGSTVRLTLIFAVPTILTAWLLTRVSPSEFHASLHHKYLEDGFLLGMFGTGILIWLTIIELVLLPILRRCLPRTSWIRT